MVISESLDAHLQYLHICESVWQAIGSMLGLIYLASLRGETAMSPIELHRDKYQEMITATVDKFEALGFYRLRNFTELEEIIGGADSFPR